MASRAFKKLSLNELDEAQKRRETHEDSDFDVLGVVLEYVGHETKPPQSHDLT